jgi:hypothetical protein
MTSIWISKANIIKNNEAAEVDLFKNLMWNSVNNMNVVEIVVLMQNRIIANERKCLRFI